MGMFNEKLKKINLKILFLTLPIFFLIPAPYTFCDILFGSGCSTSWIIGFYAILPSILGLFFGMFSNILPLSITLLFSYGAAKTLCDTSSKKFFNITFFTLLVFEIFVFIIYNPMLPLEDAKVSKIMELTYNNPIEDSHICEGIKIPSKRIGYPESDYYIESISWGKKVCFDRTYGNKLTSIKENLNYSKCEDFNEIVWENVYLKSKCYYELAPLALNESLCDYKISEDASTQADYQRHCIYNTKKKIAGGIFVEGYVYQFDSSTKLGIIPLTDREESLYWRNMLIPFNASTGYFRLENPSNVEIYVEKQGMIYRDNFTCNIEGYNFNCHFLINLSNIPKYKNRNLILYSKTHYSDQEMLQDDQTSSKIISKGFNPDENLYWYEIEYDTSLLNITARGLGAMSLYLYYDNFANRYPGLRLKLEKGEPVYVGQPPANKVSLW